MGDIVEIEAAIERLPGPQLDELIQWLEKFRQRRATPAFVEGWLARSRGAARLGTKTDEVIAQTRGEE
jgi:hypothetical protein